MGNVVFARLSVLRRLLIYHAITIFNVFTLIFLGYFFNFIECVCYIDMYFCILNLLIPFKNDGIQLCRNTDPFDYLLADPFCIIDLLPAIANHFFAFFNLDVAIDCLNLLDFIDLLVLSSESSAVLLVLRYSL